MVSSICAAALNVISCPGICYAPGSFLSNVTSARIPEVPFQSFKLTSLTARSTQRSCGWRWMPHLHVTEKSITSCWFPDHIGLRFTLILFSHLVQGLSSGPLKRGARTRVFYWDIFVFSLYKPWRSRTVTCDAIDFDINWRGILYALLLRTSLCYTYN